MAYRLGIDVGATNTVAAIAVDGAPVELLDLAPESSGPALVIMPSVVIVAEDGELRTGEEAARGGAADPSRLLTDPAGRLGTDTPLVAGGQEVSAEEATAALLRQVLATARTRQGGAPEETVVSGPSWWSEYAWEGLDRAIALAELPGGRRCGAAEAAAAAYASREGLIAGRPVLVYDLGGGSCAVSVVENDPAGLRVVAASGAQHPSGADFDEAVLRLVLGNLGEQGRELERDDPAARLQLAGIRRASRQAREELSSQSEAVVEVAVDGGPRSIRLGRPELVSLVRPALRTSLSMVTGVLAEAGIEPDALQAVVLVGGCSRTPIVAELLGRELDVPVALGSHPEYEVAIGTLLLVEPGAVADAEPRPAMATARAAQPEPEHRSGSPPERTDEDHLIFDYFSSEETGMQQTVIAPDVAVPPPIPVAAAGPPPAAAFWAEAPDTPSAARASATTYPPAAGASSQPPGYTPPGSGPPPGARPPVRPGAPPGARPGPPTQPYGNRGPGGPGGFPPGPGDSEPGPFGNRRLVWLIVGVAVLVVAALVAGVLIFRRAQSPVATPPPVAAPPAATASPSAGGASGSPAPSGSASASASAAPPAGTPGAPASGSGSPGSGPAAAAGLPAGPALDPKVVVVPTRLVGAKDRPLYLVDSEGRADPVELKSAESQNSNPMLQPNRTTIIYLSAGVLRVMGSDGSGDRELFDRPPGGCEDVRHASWSQVAPNPLVIECQVSKSKQTLLVVGLDGRLIRRLDPGKDVIGDASLSPDGQTVLYWGTDVAGADGGALYTLPVIGTGEPKKLTSSSAGEDADPSWSTDGTQVAFRRQSSGGDADVWVMNANGAGEEPVAESRAEDFKPVWSPDDRELLIVSNRKSANGGPGATFDLWRVRVSDGEVEDQLGLDARTITRPCWGFR